MMGAIGLDEPAGADDLDREHGSVRHADGTQEADAATFDREADGVEAPTERSSGDPDVDAGKPDAQGGSSDPDAVPVMPTEGGADDAAAAGDASSDDAVPNEPVATARASDDPPIHGGEADAEADAAAPGSAIWEADGGENPEAAKDAAATLEGEGATADAATEEEGEKPRLLDAPEGEPDDLKMIRGVGPKLEAMLHGMGVYHFGQIASWGPKEVAWVDRNLEGFKGRVSRDEWVDQAKTLSDGGSTAFSQRVAGGDVY